jgi:succinoglycan biosynthesis transport protein ExoP
LSPQDLIPLLRRYWIFTLALVLIGGAVGLAASLLVTPMYTSSARVFVSVSSNSASVVDLAQGGSYAEKAVDSFAEVATSPKVLQPVIDKLQLNLTPDALAKRINVDTSSTSVVMGINASDPSPARAADIANAVATQLSTAVSDLNPGSKGSATVSISSIAPAVPPKAPSSPNLPLNTLVGALLGLLLALVLVGLRRLLLNKVEVPEELETLMGSPVVGQITRDRALSQNTLRVLRDPYGSFSESIRELRTNLQYLTTAHGAQSIVVTSSGPAEGKTTTVVNLALSLAEAQSVVLVDADLRKPRIAAMLGLEGGVGLTDVLVGRVTLDEALQASTNGLVVLPSGGVPPNASELLQSDAMKTVIDELAARYSTVLFDTPPAGLLSDARVLARQCSGALVLAALGRSKRPQLKATASALSRAGARTLGVVATFVPSAFSAYYELEVAEGRQVQSRKRSRKRARGAVGGAPSGQPS